MAPAATPDSATPIPRIGPRIGIPWRTSQEEREGNREKLEYYFQAVRKAGGEPVEVSLLQSREGLERQIQDFDGFVLPGSPADVDPARYHARKQSKTKTLDDLRDAGDEAVLRRALATGIPVLAICYGCQMLNVFLKGSLIQDIRSECPPALPHGNTDLPPGTAHGDLKHDAVLAPESRLASLNGSLSATINSSHHQAISQVGENLRITAKAPDGIIEGVEWAGDGNWVVGVQWHPERMADDHFSERLFQDFVTAAGRARNARMSRRDVATPVR